MSNTTFAGPVPDDNVTLAKAHEYISRLAILFPKNPITILVFGPVNTDAYTGNYTLMNQTYTEPELLVAGVDVNSDPVEATAQFSGPGVVAPNQWMSAVGRRLDMGRPADFGTIVKSVFGRNADPQSFLADALASIAANPSTAGHQLWQVMQGKGPVVPTLPNNEGRVASGTII